MNHDRILVIRLGAMGDILHALPAVATLRASFPAARIAWAVEPRWLPLLDGNPQVDELIVVDRRSWRDLRGTWRRLRRWRAATAVDLQGLWKSALVGWASGAEHLVGFDDAREHAATVLYTRRVETAAAHVVERQLDLVAAAGARQRCPDVWVPPGTPEGQLPDEPFVLASPEAGWRSKQWPFESYVRLGELLAADGLRLVLNMAQASDVPAGICRQVSGLAGLIDATRRAVAVVGVDSGPLHLAAALGKPGVAIFGPTDPARNGPWGGTIRTLREPGATTTYRRGGEIAASMRAITPQAVHHTLREVLA